MEQEAVDEHPPFDATQVGSGGMLRYYNRCEFVVA